MHEEYILTPNPAPQPRINGAKVFGVRPGSPFLFTISATGERPMDFSAQFLPQGLAFDEKTGRITGYLYERGIYNITLKVKNSYGECQRQLKIVVGDNIALTPPMGWNSWNCWNKFIDDKKVRENADAMVKFGLINHGWTYINIDDTWQGERGVDGSIQPNEKFPNMKALSDYIHGCGLKIGIYSAPWVKTFAGHIGSTSGNPSGFIRDEERQWYVGSIYHEKADASKWSEWGMDYLKYDWNPMDLASGRRMREALLACGRDIIYNVTNSAPFEDADEWAKMAEAFFLWRAKGDIDIKDSWESISSIGFRMDKWRSFVSPGHWNDPDMLVLGQVGWGNELRACKLTPDEQYTHFSLWCLLSAPLLLGNDLTQLDEFTLSLLTNDEVLEINQDPLGIAARLAVKEGDTEIWVKELEENCLAVGLFNRSEDKKTISVKWDELDIDGEWIVRDLWRQKDLGNYEGTFDADVNSHGVVLVKLIRCII